MECFYNNCIPSGSHGAGTAHETETPIIAWGAGINHWKNMQPKDNQYV